MTKIEIEALVNYESRKLAKDRMFTWDQQRSIWFKEIDRSELMFEVRQATFAIRDLSTGEILKG